MKTINYIATAVVLITCNMSFAQMDLSKYKDVDRVHITTYWGDINATGTSADFNLIAKFTDTSKKSTVLKDMSNYVSVTKKDNTLYIENRQPKGFESIDLNLKVPENIFLEIKLNKGGNIYVDNFKNGIEVNSLNGSVTLKHIGDYAFVNATNGEIKAHFNSVNKNKPISLVTLNGGVTAVLPSKSKRDVRLISRKNGYIETDFDIKSKETITNLNVKNYSQQPISNSATINGGGALLFLSTENGPITIKKSK